MQAISGVFKTRTRGENAVQEALKAGIPADRITLLTPGTVEQLNKEIQSIPTDTTEQPGMGRAMGALAGGGVGFAGGSLLMALVPGLGPITALGMLGAAVLGAAGATIGATAPFVGLLGTVVGIIHAFQKMATSGGGIASVSAGIAEALVTTAIGLGVAIPAVWAYNYFQNRIDRFTVEMSNSGSEMAIYFLKEAGNAPKSSVA